MNYKEMRALVAQSDSQTKMADAFRKAFGIRKPKQRKQRKVRKYDEKHSRKFWERMMNNKTGCGDRFGK